jgi:hypothetical protein
VQADLALLHLEHVWGGSSLGVVDAVALFFEQSYAPSGMPSHWQGLLPQRGHGCGVGIGWLDISVGQFSGLVA